MYSSMIALLLCRLQTGAMFEGTVLHDVPEGDQHEEQEEDMDQAGPSLEEQMQMSAQVTRPTSISSSEL